jgi:hypothetical protein
MPDTPEMTGISASWHSNFVVTLPGTAVAEDRGRSGKIAAC